MPERQQFSVLVQIPAGEQDREAEYPANQQVDDRERHPVSQPSPPPGRRGSADQLRNRVFGQHTIQKVVGEAEGHHERP